MNTNELNKAVVVNFYHDVLNSRRIDQIRDVVSPDYRNAAGQGPEVVMQGAQQLIQAFPDIHWTLEEIVADDDKVIVKQRTTGTHRGVFQGHAPSGNSFESEGFALYQLAEGKIIRHQVLTDRYNFLQQIGVIS